MWNNDAVPHAVKRLTVLLSVGIVAFIFAYPVALIFVYSFATSRPGQPLEWGVEGWITAFGDESVLRVISNTFSLATVRVAISTALAIFFAWVVTRTDTPYKRFIEIMLWIGFFLPQLPLTMGWILLLDPQYGLFNEFLVESLGLSGPLFNVYSYWGIVWCHLTFSTSIRFILITPAFRAMDAALEEAAVVSGSNNFRTLVSITLPILAPSILASTALGFIKSLESFEIELVLGMPAGIYVLSTKIYDYIAWEPPLYGPATALCVVFLMAIVVLIGVQRYILGERHYTTITGRGYVTRPQQVGRLRWVLFTLCLGYIGTTTWLPVVTLTVGTFMKVFGFFELDQPWTGQHWVTVVSDPIFLRSLVNTFTLGLYASIGGLCVYGALAYFVVRTKLPGRRIVDAISWLPWALPGVLLGLGLLWVVLGTGGVFRSIYGTLVALVVAMVIKEVPLGTQTIKAGLTHISDDLEEASLTCGASRLSSFKRITLPLLNRTAISVAIIVFMGSVKEIPAIIFLASRQTRTISLLMLDYLAEQNFETAAVLGVFITAVVFALFWMIQMFGVRRNYSD
jgi:iron(III) transport system permease protein